MKKIELQDYIVMSVIRITGLAKLRLCGFRDPLVDPPMKNFIFEFIRGLTLILHIIRWNLNFTLALFYVSMVVNMIKITGSAKLRFCGFRNFLSDSKQIASGYRHSNDVCRQLEMLRIK